MVPPYEKLQRDSLFKRIVQVPIAPNVWVPLPDLSGPAALYPINNFTDGLDDWGVVQYVYGAPPDQATAVQTSVNGGVCYFDSAGKWFVHHATTSASTLLALLIDLSGPDAIEPLTGPIMPNVMRTGVQVAIPAVGFAQLAQPEARRTGMIIQCTGTQAIRVHETVAVSTTLGLLLNANGTGVLNLVGTSNWKGSIYAVSNSGIATAASVLQFLR